MNDSPPGLLFHSITPKPGEMSHYSHSDFKYLCTLLKENGYSTNTLKNMANANDTPESKQILITFDDGLESVFKYALPSLEEQRFKTTIFCMGGFYGSKSTWDIFSHNTHLTREQIISLHTLGHEIGSHTCTHAYLPFLNKDRQLKELTDSKARLEDIIGAPVTSLSFPYGGYNDQIWQLAREIGYTKATLYRNHSSSDSNLYPVEGVYRFDSPFDVLHKINSTSLYSIVRARTAMMAHFAKGTPLWKFRKTYTSL